MICNVLGLVVFTIEPILSKYPVPIKGTWDVRITNTTRSRKHYYDDLTTTKPVGYAENSHERGG